MAVVHWFGMVKKLGTGFSVEERIAVLGDRCLYLCKKNADITRCVMISNIKKLLLAQDDAKDLYVTIIMPETIEMQGENGGPPTSRAEYDIMFHCDDIQVFVKYLRTVYVYQTGGKNLPLEQVKDKGQLEEEVRLARPKEWVLTYWQPMFKEHLAKLLDAWQDGQGKGPASGGGGGGGGASGASGGAAMLGGSSSVAEAKAAETGRQESADYTSLEESPLGKFLVILSLSKYFKVLSQNKMELSLMVSGLIDDSDLEHFGVDNASDRAKIIEGLQDKNLVERLTGGATATSGLGYQPPKAVKEQLNDDFAFKPKMAADDDDLDLDLGPAPTGGVSSPKMDLNGGLDDFDLDLDDFGPMAPSGGIKLDDLDDFDLGPSPAGGGGGIGLDLDDLDLGAPAPKPAGGGSMY